jgi:hypothetical protein
MKQGEGAPIRFELGSLEEINSRASLQIRVTAVRRHDGCAVRTGKEPCHHSAAPSTGGSPGRCPVRGRVDVTTSISKMRFQLALQVATTHVPNVTPTTSANTAARLSYALVLLSLNAGGGGNSYHESSYRFDRKSCGRRHQPGDPTAQCCVHLLYAFKAAQQADRTRRRLGMCLQLPLSLGGGHANGHRLARSATGPAATGAAEQREGSAAGRQRRSMLPRSVHLGADLATAVPIPCWPTLVVRGNAQSREWRGTDPGERDGRGGCVGSGPGDPPLLASTGGACRRYVGPTHRRTAQCCQD